MLKAEKSLPTSRGRVRSTFRATWVARRLGQDLDDNGEPLGLIYAKWTRDHGIMMTHIGLAVKAGCEVVVTFRKPTHADNIADAAEIGEVFITGVIPARKRK